MFSPYKHHKSLRSLLSIVKFHFYLDTIYASYWFCRYTYKIGHRLFNGTYIWSHIYQFRASPYPGQNSLQRVVIFGDMGKVWIRLADILEIENINPYFCNHCSLEIEHILCYLSCCQEIIALPEPFHFSMMCFISQWRSHFAIQLKTSWPFPCYYLYYSAWWHLLFLESISPLLASRCRMRPMAPMNIIISSLAPLTLPNSLLKTWRTLI